MNEHLDKYLCKKYPKIFAERNLPMNQTCMCWGFEHGNGWFFLLDTLCQQIQYRVDHPPLVFKKTLRVRAVRFWNWLVKVTALPARWYTYSDDLLEPLVIPQVVARQVKEKFGGLRFYHTGGDADIEAMVHFAESLSYKICEHCGVMNELVNQTEGWIVTSCPCCISSHMKQNLMENRHTEMIELWQSVRNSETNDRKK